MRSRRSGPTVHLRVSFLFGNELRYFALCGYGNRRFAQTTTETTQVNCRLCLNKLHRSVGSVNTHFEGFRSAYQNWRNTVRR